MKFEGAKALITGGSEGIGRSIAESMISRGATVAITGRRADVLEKAAAEIGAQAICGDVSVEADAIRTMETFVKTNGRIDVLVNNAGIGYFAPITDMDLASFEKVFAVNVTGAMLMGREAAKHFVSQESGHLLNISSTSGLKGGRGGTAYSASKFALKGMTECWRDELRPKNVRVTLVNPSEVLTDFAAKVGYDQKPSEKKLRAKEIADAVVGVLEVDDRGFVPEFSVFATNPF